MRSKAGPSTAGFIPRNASVSSASKGVALHIYGGAFPAGLDLTKLFVRYRNIRVKTLD